MRGCRQRFSGWSAHIGSTGTVVSSPRGRSAANTWVHSKATSGDSSVAALGPTVVLN